MDACGPIIHEIKETLRANGPSRCLQGSTNLSRAAMTDGSPSDPVVSLMGPAVPAQAPCPIVTGGQVVRPLPTQDLVGDPEEERAAAIAEATELAAVVGNWGWFRPRRSDESYGQFNAARLRHARSTHPTGLPVGLQPSLPQGSRAGSSASGGWPSAPFNSVPGSYGGSGI